jgi:uncharacterized protein YndB with AHSA1/START domain
MNEQSVNHATFVIERSFPASPERVFAAFSDPTRKSLWFSGGKEREVELFEMDFRVGGHDHVRYRTAKDSPLQGAALSNETVYQDIVPDSRIVIAYTMAVDDQRISASLATFELVPTSSGTNLIFTEQAAFFENSDGPQIREHGWQSLLNRLAEELER